MTCCVAILNRFGAALAADTAVTLETNPPKIFHNHAKLFRYPHEPVALMVAGNGGILNVPWPVIMERYFAARAPGERFDTLNEYWDDLMRFIGSAEDLFPPEIQAKRLLLAMKELWDELSVEGMIDGSPDRDFNDDLQQVVDADREACRKWPRLEGRSEFEAQAVVARHKEALEELMAEIFPMIELSARSKTALLETAEDYLTYARSRNSEILLVGMGERDVFPRYIRGYTGAVIDGVVKRARLSSAAIDHENPIIVAPLGERSTIDTLIDGIHPTLRSRLPEIFIENLHGAANGAGVSIDTADALGAFNERLDGMIRGWHSDAMLSGLEAQSAEDLRESARWMVDTTARMAWLNVQRPGDVGGRIDVEILTR